MDRRTVALGIAAAGAVAAAVIVALPNHQSSRRTALVSYVDAVDGVQARMKYSLTNVLEAYRTFATSKTITPSEQTRLERAERTLTKLRRRLASIASPPDAHVLRLRLLRLVALETAIAREVNELARFVPPYATALAGLHTAASVLARRLASTQPPQPHVVKGTKKQIAQAQAAFATASATAATAEADSVATYDEAVAKALRELRPLSPPPALAPAYRAQLQGLEATVAAGQLLVAELRKKNRSQVQTLGRAFTNASRQSQSLPAQRAEIAAVKTYNARVRRVGALELAVQKEAARLSNSPT